jgi:hypothetical protein
VKKKLGKRRYERLVSALAMCVGIEALIVLRDLRGLGESEAEEVSRWAARTLLRESLAEAEPRTGKEKEIARRAISQRRVPTAPLPPRDIRGSP